MRQSRASHLTLLLLTTPATLAQLLSGAPGSSPSGSSGSTLSNQLCNKTFSLANSTGFYPFSPYVTDANIPLTWAGTVFQSNTSTSLSSSPRVELSLWFNTGNQNYTDSNALGYDACYLFPGGLALTAAFKGQNDTGDCIATMDEACVGDMIDLTNLYSARITGLPTGLNSSSLPNVCNQLARDLTQNFPKSCKPFFNSTGAAPYTIFGGTPALGGPLTGEDSLVQESTCTLEDDVSGGGTGRGNYSLMWTQFGENTLFNYFAANYLVVPLITAFMPIANEDRPVTLGSSKAFMSCGRAKNLTEGSLSIPDAREAAASLGILPNGNGTGSDQGAAVGNATEGATDEGEDDGGISGGAIAGIVIGVVIGLALIAAAVWFFVIRKKRRSHSGMAELNGHEESKSKDARQYSVEAPNEHAVSEMGGAYPEHAHTGWDHSQAVELPTYRNPAELGAK
ncbi:hypothetical protein CKM354_001134000 [Cercospora kikuchii]|uniref:Uncharacterized protein n=1 Tax=Cercospora kikuchii TaxID=84275 RepID=A0A9P3FK90_9PEZI|nr:uncharacterized protein CKM354_001134000 [Cercospora kikuchii]GIZ48272.1 hypothetical protein CKM354_001134000 [Cercospora kikuchii]